MFSALFNKIKIYLFSQNTIWLLKKEAGTAIPDIPSLLQVQQISLPKRLSDVLYAEPNQNLSIYEDLLKQGELCFYGYIEQKYVARCWLVLSGAQLSYLRAWRKKLPSNSAYIHRLYTVPSERGKHIARKLIADVCCRYQDKDIFSMVLPTKPESLKVFYECGFSPVNSVRVRYFCFIPFVEEILLSGEQVL